MQTCKSCQKEKPYDSFYKSTRCISGYRGTCKSCCAISSKARYDQNNILVGCNQSNLPMPTQAELKNLFEYHSDGYFIRKTAKGRSKKGSMVNGKVERSGYRRLGINYNMYLLHRLIWKWHCGSEPEFIDHINRNRLDNRIENLRECTKSDNARNQVLPKNNTSGFYGIRWHEYYGQAGCWVVKVSHNGTKTTKRCDSLLEAVNAYEKIAAKHHGEFALDKIAHNRRVFDSM